MAADAGPAAARAYRFADDGTIPNHPRLPFLVHAPALDPAAERDVAAAFEALFGSHGWPPAWRDGIYPFPHYHAVCHEALGVARGRARVRFGGAAGTVLELAAGDAAVLPAGTGHQRLEGSPDLLVVGAYPAGSGYDLRRGDDPRARAGAAEAVALVPVPALDPVLGTAGGVALLWAAAP